MHSPANWDTGKTMSSLTLVFEAPSRGLPPRHLADLSPEQRAEAIAALGDKPLRARQLSHHYFGRLSVDAASMTDIPASARERLVREMLPPLLTQVRNVSCDDGATSKSLWRAHDGTLLESVVMRYPDRATVCVSSQFVWCMSCCFFATG
jgi:23S rRNA (adenine2503-C2)-methyltransferase